MEMESVLPSFDELGEELRNSKMRVVCIDLVDVQWVKVETKFDYEKGEGRGEVGGLLCNLDGYGEVSGYIPSKVFWLNGSLKLVYYVNVSLPEGVKPFSGRTYILISDMVIGGSFLYDVGVRMFMDQVRREIDWVNVIIFDSESFSDIIVGREDE
jgi:hypothetical protein